MTARLYLAPDSYGDPTIWRDTGDDRDEAVLTRTGGNYEGFDALAGLVAMRERAEALADEWEGIASRCEQRWPDAPPCGPCIERREHARALRAALDGSAS